MALNNPGTNFIDDGIFSPSGNAIGNGINVPSFSPSNIAGLQAWYDATYGVYQDGAAHFTSASNQYLSIPDNASLSMGSNTNFTIAIWVYADSLGTNNTALAKYGGAGQAGYAIYMPGDVPTLIVSSDGTAVMTVSTGSTMATGGWHLLIGWYDGTNINISIDNGTTHSTAFSAGVFDNTAQFQLSGITSGQYWNGALDSVFVTKRVLTPAERTALYNSGAGQTYSSAQTAIPSIFDASAISWWDLNEESGTRFDAIGTNDLTASTLAIISGATLNGNFETAGTNGGTITNVPTSTVARAANIATIVTGIAHGLSSTNVVTVTGVTDTTFNAVSVVVTVVNATTFTYPNTGSVVVTASDTGGRIATDVFANWTEVTDLDSLLSNETSIVHAGTHAVKLVAGATSAANVGIEQVTATIVGNKYNVTFFSRCDAGVSSIVVGGATSGFYVFQPNTATYTQYTVTFTATQTNFGFRRSFPGSTNYIDDVVLTDLGPVGIAGIATGIAVDGNFCGNFVRSSSQYFSIASNSTLQSGTSDFTYATWVFPTNNGSGITMAIGSKDDQGANREWALYSSGSDLKFNFQWRGTDTVQSSDLGLYQWNLVVIQRDTANSLIKIQVNNGTPVTASTTVAGLAGSAAFQIGAINGNYWDGRIDATGWWKGTLLTPSQLTALFNHGNGLKSGGLAAAGVPTPISYWDMDKVLGITADSIGTNTLTNNNAVTFAQGVDYFGGAVSKWLDRSTNSRNLLQATESKRPVWYSGVQNGKPAILFDGVDDFMAFLNSIASTPSTIFAVTKHLSSAVQAVIGGTSTSLEYRFNTDKQEIVRQGVALIAAGGANVSEAAFSVTAFSYDRVDYALYLNGASDGAGASATAAMAALTNIGTADGSEFLNGYIAELIIYGSILTTPQITQVNNYLKQKWGTP